MRGSTVQLREIIAGNEKAKKFIKECWKSLYFKLMDNNADWDTLDDVSAFAIQDLDVHGLI